MGFDIEGLQDPKRIMHILLKVPTTYLTKIYGGAEGEKPRDHIYIRPV